MVLTYNLSQAVLGIAHQIVSELALTLTNQVALRSTLARLSIASRRPKAFKNKALSEIFPLGYFIQAQMLTVNKYSFDLTVSIFVD